MGKKKHKDRKNGKARNVQVGKSKNSRRAVTAIVIVALIAIAALAVSSNNQDAGTTGTGSATGGSQAPTSQSAIQPTDVKAAVDNGGITVDEAEVRKVGNVYFEYQRADRAVPLMAYVGPKSGKIITAISLCEPCRGQKFRIEGDRLICNTCGSVYEVETHKGISGACVDYEPTLLPSSIAGGRVAIQELAVSDWEPRV